MDADPMTPDMTAEQLRVGVAEEIQTNQSMNNTIKLFWYQEKTEVWAAADLQSFNAEMKANHTVSEEFRKNIPHWEPVPDFTEENKGDVWGEADPNDTVVDEDTREEMTLQQAAEKAPNLPWPICTQYA